MKKVIDASLAVKWYVAENYTAEAEKLLDGSFDLHAPELIIPEFGNIIWKKIRIKDLTAPEGSQIIDVFRKQKITFHSHAPLAKVAFIGAQMTGQTVYDWSYLSLAVSLDCEFVTADERFYKALEKTRLKKHLLWVGDI